MYLHVPRSVTDYCCLNSTYLEVMGRGCFSTWRDVARYTETRGACTWTGWGSLDIQLDINIYNYLSRWSEHACARELRRVSRVCRVQGRDCVVRQVSYLHIHVI